MPGRAAVRSATLLEVIAQSDAPDGLVVRASHALAQLGAAAIEPLARLVVDGSRAVFAALITELE